MMSSKEKTTKLLTWRREKKREKRKRGKGKRRKGKRRKKERRGRITKLLKKTNNNEYGLICNSTDEKYRNT